MSVKRTAIFRWLAGAATIAGLIVFWQPLSELSLGLWLSLGSIVLLAAVTVLLGIDPGIGPITFLPVIAMLAYLTVGFEYALMSLTAGLVLGSSIRLALLSRHGDLRRYPWWRTVGEMLVEPGRNGLALAAADFGYRMIGNPPPLVAVNVWADLLPVVEALGLYVLVYDVLMGFDIWLRVRGVRRTARENWTLVLGIQVLPLALAPFAAVARARIGLLAFFIFEATILTIMLVVRRLTQAQTRLSRQVDQLRALSTMNRSMQASLESDALLRTVYLQASSLLNIKNMMIVLDEASGQPTNGGPNWRPVMVVKSGQRLEKPETYAIDGLTKWVLKEEKPLVAASVEQTVADMDIDFQPLARTWMGVPLLAPRGQKGAVVTWLEPGEQPGRSFSEIDGNTLTAVAGQTEIAMENAHLYKEAQQQASQLARLNEISTMLNASLNPEKLLELIAASVIDIAGCDRAAIYLLDEDPNNPALLLTHSQGFSPEHIARSKDIAVPLTEDERRAVLVNGKPITVSNLKGPEANVSAAALVLAEHEKFTAYSYIPLRAQARMIGMLAVYYNKPHQFTESELELLTTFANQAALAVINARIYQSVDIQLAKRVGQMMKMSDIMQRLGSTLDLDTIFKFIIDSAIDGCAADAGVLVLTGNPVNQDDDDTEPHMVAWRGFDPASNLRAPHRIAEDLAQSEVLERGETRILSVDDPNHLQPYSQLCVPIFLENKVIGAIALESEILNAFTDEDLSFVSQLAVQAAVAIRNAQLYRHSQAVRDRLHAILDSSNDGLLMFDPKMRIAMTNTRMGDFWDFARGDFQPRTQEDFMSDPVSVLGEGLGYKENELSALIQRGIKNPGMNPETDLYVTRGGSSQRQRFVERTATPVRDEDGRFIGMLLLFRDVTDQKELEETRQNLTSMIVHELRSPLQAVMGSMKLIEQVTPEGDPIVEQATDVSKRAVKKLLNLVNNLLDLSRMEVGEFVLDPSLEEVRPIITDSVEEVMPLAKEMGSVIKVEIADDLPYARIDRDMVERVVLNLLDNALKYTEPGSLLTAGARLPDKTEDGDLKIEMFVSDQGPGVPDDYKEAIFERFSQVPGRKGRRRSAGLGLAFSKLAIESHGGRIWVEDNPKGGSIFKFVLPAAYPPPEAPDAEPEKEPEKKPKETPAEKPEAASPPPQIEGGQAAGENGKKPEEMPAATGDGAESPAASEEKPSGDAPPKSESE